jgi:hypothetical protein
MSSISLASTKAVGLFVVLAAAALSGCATTGGTARSFGKATVNSEYLVCSGGHASRFPEQEQIGRVCLPSVTLRHMY